MASGESVSFANWMVWGVWVTSGLIDQVITCSLHTELTDFLKCLEERRDFIDALR